MTKAEQLESGRCSRAYILRAIDSLFAEGHVPTVREIGKRSGLSSSSTVHAHLKTLERDGAVRRLSSVGGRIQVYIPARKDPFK